jgi:hypothetical protein
MDCQERYGTNTKKERYRSISSLSSIKKESITILWQRSNTRWCSRPLVSHRRAEKEERCPRGKDRNGQNKKYRKNGPRTSWSPQNLSRDPSNDLRDDAEDFEKETISLKTKYEPVEKQDNGRHCTIPKAPQILGISTIDTPT